MAHFVRTHTDSEWTNGGLGGYITLESDWEDLDSKIFRAINGERGGTWAPSSEIVFGDVGNTASPSLVVNGPTLVAYGGSVRTLAGSRFICSPTTVPRLGVNHVGRKRRIICHCIRRIVAQPYLWSSLTATASIQSIALTIIEATGGQSGTITPSIGPNTVYATPLSKALVQPSFRVPLDVHDGARLATATFSFRVPTPRSSAPLVMPRFRIIAVDEFGNVLPLKKTSDGTGFNSPPTPSGGSTWYAGGAVQTFVYTCDQNNIIDISTYHYEAEVIEEAAATDILSAAADGNFVLDKHPSVQTLVTTPTVLSGGLSDGGLNDGDRVLVTNQLDSTQNGIYVAHSGSWTRATDAADASGLTPHSLVAIGGNGVTAPIQIVQIAQVWQLQSATAINVGTDKNFWARRVARGNIYHSVALDFDQIIDMRLP